MAVVKEGVCSTGARYRILDDAYANCTPEELERRRKRVCEIAYNAMVNEIRLRMEREEKERHETD